MTRPSDPMSLALLSEIAMVDQLARQRLSTLLPVGMELSHFSVLNHLSFNGSERTPAQLARVFQVTKGAMTNTVGKLERAGQVTVRPDRIDRRRKLVSINAAGEAARNAALDAIGPVLDEWSDRLGSDTMRTLLPMLRDLRQMVGRS